MPKKTKTKKCSKKKRLIWYAFGATGLGAKCLASLALLAIAVKLYPIKTQAKFFNVCVEEARSSGQNVSDAVNFCNGGS